MRRFWLIMTMLLATALLPVYLLLFLLLMVWMHEQLIRKAGT